MDLRPAVARALGERLRQLRRVDVPIVRVVESGANTLGGDEGMAGADLLRAQHLEFDPLGPRLGYDVAKFIDAIAAVRQPEAPRDVVVDVVADTLCKLRIEPGAVALQLDQVPGSREIRAIAGRVPGRSGRQLIALEQDRIADAQLREVIHGTAAHRATTDYDHLSVRLHSFYAQLLMRSPAGSYQGRNCTRAAC